MPAKTGGSGGLRASSDGKPRTHQRKPPATASDYVSNEIRQGILDGTFDLGSRLDQQVLADRLGVSIIPIRESLRQLEAEGLVEILPRRGAFVAKLSLEEVVEVITIRERLEELVVRLAGPHLDAAQLARAADLNQRMARMPPEGQALQWSELNRQFHFMIYAQANSPLLLQIITTLWDRSRLYREVNAGRARNRIQAVAEHAEILRRLTLGDQAGAASAVRKHIRRSVRDLMASEAATKPRGSPVLAGSDAPSRTYGRK
jgi:DNA-binding GntR family transcriptional regulator